jgi:PAS domain S-box-containing protein
MDKPVKRYSLRVTVFQITAVCFFALLILFSSIFFPIMISMIHGAEDILVYNLRTVITESLEEKKSSIRQLTLVYANWDETVSYVEGKSPNYIEENWPKGVVAREHNLDVVAFSGPEGITVYEEFFDYLKGTAMPQPPGFPQLMSRLHEKVWEKYRKDSGDFNTLAAEEILFLGENPYYICAAPVAVYTESEAPRGIFVMGVLLTNEYLRSITHYPLTTFRILNSEDSAARDPDWIDRSSGEVMSINVPINNPGGENLILEATRERRNLHNGRQVIIFTFVILCAAILGVFIVLGFFFQRSVLRPIFLLNREVAQIRGNAALQMKGYGRQVEIYSLALAINNMLRHLTDKEEAEARLLQRIRQQELMRELSQAFASGDDTRTNIENSLARVGGFLSAGRVSIAHINMEEKITEYPYVWMSGQAGGRRIEPRAFDPGDVLYKELARGDKACIAVNDSSDTCFPLPRNTDGSVKAFVSVPIHVAQELWGILTIDVFDAPRRWSKSDLQLIGLIQNELSNDIAKSMIKDDLLRSSAILKNSPRFVLFMNSAGSVEYVNPALVSDSGYGEEEIKTKGLALLIDAGDLRLTEEKYLPLVREQGRADYDAVYIRKNGQRRILACTSFSIRLQNDETAIALTASDMTEMYALQKELVAAKEHAEYYNTAKSNFISRMSHEMRTPMNTILGMAGIAESSADTERKNYCLGKIQTSAHDLLDIINNMLDMVKFENKTFELAAREFDVTAMLNSVADMFKARAAEKRQSFTADIARDMPPSVLCDEKALRHVLVNILGNAVKFTPEGGSVKFSACADSEGGDSLVLKFQVSDTGIGIQPAHQEYLWEAFEQREGGITRRYGGVGLGLVIAKNIVGLMNGDIRLVSEPGRGSAFSFTVQAGLPARAVEMPPAATPDRTPFAGRAFLLADDIELNREIVIAMLSDTGAAIDCAVDGGDTVKKFSSRGGSYDLILMDLHMPGVDGFEAARRIRSSGLPGCADVPIIAVTADTGGEVVTKCLAAGMNDHIGKPVDMDELLKTISKRLKN